MKIKLYVLFLLCLTGYMQASTPSVAERKRAYEEARRRGAPKAPDFLEQTVTEYAKLEQENRTLKILLKKSTDILEDAYDYLENAVHYLSKPYLNVLEQEAIGPMKEFVKKEVFTAEEQKLIQSLLAGV